MIPVFASLYLVSTTLSHWPAERWDRLTGVAEIRWVGSVLLLESGIGSASRSIKLSLQTKGLARKETIRGAWSGDAVHIVCMREGR